MTEQTDEAGPTDDLQERHWLTNDLALLWILTTYMTVWAMLRLAPILFGIEVTIHWALDTGALLALASGLTWGFGVDALEEWESFKRGD